MQKVIRRAKYAQNRAQIRVKRTREIDAKAETWNLRDAYRRHNKVVLKTEREARNNRKEDWDAGPLAPRREVGEKAVSFGASHVYYVNRPDVQEENRPRWQHIVEGDRVVITQGRDRGKIGKITEYFDKKAACKVEGLNLIDVHMPEWLQREQGINEAVSTTEQAVPIEHLRLVFALQDPETGGFRDTVIDRLECIGRKFDKSTREWNRGNRVIPGTNTIIPWPESEKSDSVTDYPADTPRLSVDELTFEPYLLAPPMPLSVIDELRNRYSKFRTQHDYDYIMKKESEETKAEDRTKLAKTMHTPLQELAALRAKEKVTPKLTADQLAKIGEVIAQEQVRVTGAIRREQR